MHDHGYIPNKWMRMCKKKKKKKTSIVEIF